MGGPKTIEETKMEGRFLAEKPQEIVFTLKITASVSEWEELRDQLIQRYPSGHLSHMITDLLAQARKAFYETHETPKP